MTNDNLDEREQEDEEDSEQAEDERLLRSTLGRRQTFTSTGARNWTKRTKEEVIAKIRSEVA